MAALGFVLFYLVFAVGLGLGAKQKNRNSWAWGVIGGLIFWPAAILLTLLPYLCPKCKQPMSKKEFNNQICPRCGDLKKIN